MLMKLDPGLKKQLGKERVSAATDDLHFKKVFVVSFYGTKDNFLSSH